MPFPDLRTRPRSLTLLDLMVVTLVTALPMAAIVTPIESVSGRRSLEAAPLLILLTLEGYGLGWLSEMAARGRPRWLAPLALPALLGMAVLYIFLGLFCFLGAPIPAALVLIGQFIALVYMVFRP